MENPTFQPVSWAITDISNDTIKKIVDGDYSAANPAMTAYNLVNADSRFWIEDDFDGNPQLCTMAQAGKELVLVANDGVSDYNVSATPFEVIVNSQFEFIGGRPPVKR